MRADELAGRRPGRERSYERCKRRRCGNLEQSEPEGRPEFRRVLDSAITEERDGASGEGRAPRPGDVGGCAHLMGGQGVPADRHGDRR